MIHKLTYFQDLNLNKDIGINFHKSEIQTFLSEMFNDVGEEKGKYYNMNLLTKNNGVYHLTLITQEELNTLTNNSNIVSLSQAFNNLFDITISDIKIKGVGKVERFYKVEYYVLIESESLNDIRKNFLLPEKDLYITIGISHDIIHNINKNKVMEPKNTFLEELKKEYIKDLNNFDFIKSLKDYPGTEMDNIEIVKLKDSWAQFRYSKNKYICVAYIDGLKIVSIFEDNDKLKILSYTLVNKKLKINI